MNAGSQVGQEARHVAESGPIKLLGRIGIVAYGVVHLLLAYLAIQVAIEGSSGGQKTDKGGALQTLADQPGGKFLLWVIAVGLAALALWQIAEAIWGHRGVQPERKRNKKRLVNVGEAVIFGALAFSAFKIATGGGAGSSSTQQSFTAKVLDMPGGQLLVGAIGVAIMVIAGFVIHHGITKRFTEDLDLSQASMSARKTAIRLGQVGFTAVGIAYGVVGLLVVVAAAQHEPNKATGLDVALRTLAAQPYGTALLAVVALGLACFGAYCLFDARYRRG